MCRTKCPRMGRGSPGRERAPQDGGVQSAGTKKRSRTMVDPQRPCHHPAHQHIDQVPMMRGGFWYLKCPLTSSHDMVSSVSFLPHHSPEWGRAGRGALMAEPSQKGIPPPPHCDSGSPPPPPSSPSITRGSPSSQLLPTVTPALGCYPPSLPSLF